jgi:LasA protease
MKKPWLALLFLALAILACSRPGNQEVLYVTATFPGGERVLHETPTPSSPTETPIQPTPNPTRVAQVVPIEQGGTYTVKPGDTLAQIATAAGTTLETLMQTNGILNPDLLEVGQVLTIPDMANAPVVEAPPTGGTDMKLLPDSEVVYGPTAADFDVREYVKLKNGFLRAYSDERNGEYVTGVELLYEVSTTYSINPRLLLALLEYRGQWLSEPTVSEDSQTYPMGLVDANRAGLYNQLLDAANALNAGYYGWKYRGLTTITFADGRSVEIAPNLNPGTAAVQYFFSRSNTLEGWTQDVSEGGFFQVYLAMFGDPFASAYEPMIPSDLSQPSLTFPFGKGETWYFTGGPHGGYNTGSAWSSVDFAPPNPPDSLIAEQGYCYVSPYYVTAAAPGVIARSGNGFIILDLDFDGNEHTGWTLVYLHINDDENLVKPGTRVETGDRLGKPSCQGGFSSATHLHFGRRYNGEWIPVDCFNCGSDTPHALFVLDGWTVRGYENQEYQGYMEGQNGDMRRAEQGREDPINQVNW